MRWDWCRPSLTNHLSSLVSVCERWVRFAVVLLVSLPLITRCSRIWKSEFGCLVRHSPANCAVCYLTAIPLFRAQACSVRPLNKYSVISLWKRQQRDDRCMVCEPCAELWGWRVHCAQIWQTFCTNNRICAVISSSYFRFWQKKHERREVKARAYDTQLEARCSMLDARARCLRWSEHWKPRCVDDGLEPSYWSMGKEKLDKTNALMLLRRKCLLNVFHARTEIVNGSFYAHPFYALHF